MNYNNLGYAVVVAATAAVLIIGSAVPSEAKGKNKKAEAAPAPTPVTCIGSVRAPVCASRGDMKFTYANACYAAKDGAKSAKAGECKPAKAAKKGKKAAKKKK